MKWSDLPGPSGFIKRVIGQVRQGMSMVVAAPLLLPPEFESAITDVLDNDRWSVHKMDAGAIRDPLPWLTDQLYIEPQSWVEWSVESLFERLSPNQVICIQGVTRETWEDWCALLRDFEVASRRRPADERAVLVVFIRGVPAKRLQVAGAALSVEQWTGALGEFDVQVYVDQRIRETREVTSHHKLIVRQVAALALWDLQLADFLIEQPPSDLFDATAVLQTAIEGLKRQAAMGATWEEGGADCFDDRELLHPFVLVTSNTERSEELAHRVWAAQAAELLPRIEVRRRACINLLRRHIPCPFWIDSNRKVETLDELEIGSLAYAAHTHKEKVPSDLCLKVQWLADCRNALAHFRPLDASTALDYRLHE